MNPAWRKAKKHFAGGVNSPVRAFKAVGGDPVFMKQGLGPYLYDSDNKRYIDFCLSWGAILFGHADETTIRAVQEQAGRGTSFGTATEYETSLAILIKKAFPKMDKLRFTSSGTEAVMSAVRLARGVTNRERIVKFEGCYHGHADSLLVKAGSGLATFGTPSSTGIPRALAALTSVLPYNDPAAVDHFFKIHHDVACILVEPVAGNMGVIPATPAFLTSLRRAADKSGALLIFDEVISGFRVAYGGAQHLYKIEPDITILGKIIGGGLPVGAFGARAKIMDALSPDGSVYQAGTLSGNPLSMAAGISVLSRLEPAFYTEMNSKTARFTNELSKLFKKRRKPISIHTTGSMFTIFFSQKTPKNFTESARQDTKSFSGFFRKMLAGGLYLPPSAFEASFLCAAHSENEMDQALKAFASW